ncbi:DUF7560 family zinc ribbon protein [Salinigranum sp. GCM10025319]|uniref:DUF7560 family zinc ribbon protein n=1 Tax=Salinigranum sp. GCM10025319 TaxID=3252687 RepID=UPI00360DEA70
MARTFTFDCPVCEVCTVVDDDVRDLVLDEGCVLCAADVTRAAFSPSSRGRDR